MIGPGATLEDAAGSTPDVKATMDPGTLLRGARPLGSWDASVLEGPP